MDIAKYEKIFTELFYHGGCFLLKSEIKENKKVQDNCCWFFEAWARNWSIKHEVKTAVCAYILSLIHE